MAASLSFTGFFFPLLQSMLRMGGKRCLRVAAGNAVQMEGASEDAKSHYALVVPARPEDKPWPSASHMTG